MSGDFANVRKVLLIAMKWGCSGSAEADLVRLFPGSDMVPANCLSAEGGGSSGDLFYENTGPFLRVHFWVCSHLPKSGLFLPTH